MRRGAEKAEEREEGPSWPVTATGDSSGQARPAARSVSGARIAVATSPLAAWRTTGSVSFASARVMSMKKENRTADEKRQQRGGAHRHEARLHHH